MDKPKSPFKLTPQACFFLLLFTTIIHSFSARILGGLPPPLHHHHKTMTFYMPNMLNSTTALSAHHPPTTPPTIQVNGQPIPFSKPLGLFPPVKGIPVPDFNSRSSQTSGLLGIGTGISFSASDILREELEFGMVNAIDVDLLEKTNLYGLTLLGRAKGMYVASLEIESTLSQMMAMTISFVDNEFKDELRFFGLHQADMNSESHVSIIGGSGKYEGANGYATIKASKLRSEGVKKDEKSDVFLLVDVYLG